MFVNTQQNKYNQRTSKCGKGSALDSISGMPKFQKIRIHPVMTLNNKPETVAHKTTFVF